MKAFIVRVWRDKEGRIQGQVSDPLTDARVPFSDADELWRFFAAENLPDHPGFADNFSQLQGDDS